MATPALLVPDTVAGKLYAQIPKICAAIADTVAKTYSQSDLYTFVENGSQDLRVGARDHLENLLLHGPGALTLDEIAQMGVEGFKQYWAQIKLFTWDPAIERWDFETWGGHRVPLPIQQRAPDHWSINPAFAYAYLGKARDFTGRVRYIDEGGGLCFASHHPQFGITFSGGVAWAIRESIMYMTWRLIGNDNFQVNVTPAWQMDPLFLEPWSDADYALDAAARAAEQPPLDIGGGA